VGRAGGEVPPPDSRNGNTYRHEWYQTPTAVTLGVLVKACPKDAVSVAFKEESVRVAIAALGDTPEFALDLCLQGRVVPGECSFTVLSSRVEVRLSKATGATWTALEKAEGAQGAPGAGGADAGLPRPYSSTKKTVKDWDGLEADLGREDDKLEGDAALQKLFQDIYLKGNEETRRAMNKSFQESNGTVLSTNWGEVGSGQVDAKPPDGMEAKRYPTA
jgi:suppressor of G2 allele of SKP1